MSRIPSALGSLCLRKHDHGGGSLRYLVNGQPIGSCVDCGRAANNERRASLRAARAKKANAQKRDDGKFLGTLCSRGHDNGGGSLRYVYDGSCVTCDLARNERRRNSGAGNVYERTRKHAENRERAISEFLDPDLREERASTFEAESQLRGLRKRVRQHGQGRS